jgi:tetratricopeptide (TPR) repeat protein
VSRLGLAGRTLTLALVLAALAPAGCGKKDGGGTAAPGGAGAAKPDVEALKAQAKATGLIELANKDLAAGRYISAARRADEALQSNPNDADAYAVLGAARWRAGDAAASTEAFRKALELDPKNFGANLGLGQNLQASGMHGEAVALADKLLADDAKQIDPLLSKLQSLYVLGRASEALLVVDELFKYIAEDAPELPGVQAYAAFIRPLADKGALIEVVGEQGTSDLQTDVGSGVKHSGAVVGGEYARVVFLEGRVEALVDTEFAAKIGAKELAKLTPVGMEEGTGLVLLPELKFGELVIRNVPALVTDLSAYEGVVGERPGVVLGQQVLMNLGSVTWDYAGSGLTLRKAAAAAPAGAVEAPLLLLGSAPAIPMTIDRGEQPFFLFLGGTYGAGVALTRKAYLKSGHLPRELEPLDDATNGLKMVYVERLGLGSSATAGMGALVLVNNPPDPNLDALLQATRFELGGYVNMSLLKTWAVQWNPGEGKAFISLPAAAATAG